MKIPGLKRLVKFIVERHAIYERRLQGKPRAQWTRDEILRTYRFCNVYRELDRTTQWIADHWRNPHADHPDLWFAMVVARFINHPPTLEDIALPGRWNKTQFLEVMRDRKELKEKMFGSAYIVSTNGRAMDKALYVAQEVLDPLWEKRKELRPHKEDTLGMYHAALVQFQGIGSFMAAQVIADLKYVKPLDNAVDWWSFAASGPGSKRGMNRVFGQPVKKAQNEYRWSRRMRRLNGELMPIIKNAGMQRLHAQDVQNCLCEFDKYERARFGEGRPKQKFTPHG